MKKSENKKGFTLAELLIVLAIIAVLTAIAVPVFSLQLEKARVAVDEANARSATSMAQAHYLMNHSNEKSITYYFRMNGNNLEIAYHTAPPSPSAGYAQDESSCKLEASVQAQESFAESDKYSGEPLTVTITADGSGKTVISNSWLDD